MMKKLLLTTLAAGLVLTLGTSCNEAPEPTTGSGESMPVEGAGTTTAQGGLMTYDGPAENIPVMAQYPDTMEVMAAGSGEGVGVFFTFKPQGNALDDAEVHVFLPANTPSTTELMPMITGPNGLIENNGWSLDNTRADNVSDFPYPWVEMVFDISTDMEQSGHIVIGQTNGQAVQVVVLYPAEMADAYWASARTVLNSLEFDPDLLPVTTSEQP
jgi:hypothetical protein